MLASGQQLEQLYIPGPQENYIQTLNYLKSKFCMARLVPNFSHTSMFTLLERRIWTGAEFTFMWPNLRVESPFPSLSTSLSDGSRTLPIEERGLLSLHAVGDFA